MINSPRLERLIDQIRHALLRRRHALERRQRLAEQVRVKKCLKAGARKVIPVLVFGVGVWAGRRAHAEVALPVHVDEVFDDGAGLGERDGWRHRAVDHGRCRPRRVQAHEHHLALAVFHAAVVDEQLVLE